MKSRVVWYFSTIFLSGKGCFWLSVGVLGSHYCQFRSFSFVGFRFKTLTSSLGRHINIQSLIAVAACYYFFLSSGHVASISGIAGLRPLLTGCWCGNGVADLSSMGTYFGSQITLLSQTFLVFRTVLVWRLFWFHKCCWHHHLCFRI